MPCLQPLLLWQSLSLFWFCGLLLPQYPTFALGASCLFLYIDSRLRTWPTLVVALCLIIVGFTATVHTLPQRPEQPPWTLEQGRPVAVRLEGVVSHVQSLPDKRLRVFLENVRAVHGAQEAILPGKTVWTWEQAAWFSQSSEKDRVAQVPTLAYQRPVAGQRVRITAKVRDTDSFRHEGSNDFGFYWQTQGVFWRIWSRGAQGTPEISGQAHTLSEKREGIFRYFSHAVQELSAHTSALQEQALAFLPALLMGEKFFLAQTTLDSMQALSLVHSLALSGQHLSFVVLLAWFLVMAMAFVLPYTFLYVPRKKLLFIISLPLALLYLWLGNAPPSLIRAACMLFMAGFFLWRSTAITLGQVVLCTLLCITVYDPLSIYNIGLQLSALCVASISLVLPLLRRILPQREHWEEGKSLFINFIQVCGRKTLRVSLQILLISFTLQCALLPLFLLYFSPSGLWFMANVLWLPILTFWVIPLGALGLGIGYCFSFSGGLVLFSLAALPCEGLLYMAQWMQHMGLLNFSAVLRPHGLTALGWIPLCLGMAFLTGRIQFAHLRQGCVSLPQVSKRLFFAAACLLCVAPLVRYGAHLQNSVHMELLDVGQGQAILLSLPGGNRILVDGGGSFSPRFDPGTDIVLPRVVYNGAPRLWAMVSTHPDVDHLRGLIHILPKISVQHFYDNGEAFSAAEQALWTQYAQQTFLLPRQKLYAGMKIHLPSKSFWKKQSLYLEVLSPVQKTSFTGNEASLVLRLVRDDGKKREGLALFCGDAERTTLQKILESGQDVRAQVLVLAHHGAKDAFLPNFYKKVAPQVVLASAGRQNSYGHPSAVVRQELHKQNMALYVTAEEGAIKLTWHEELHIQSQRKLGIQGHLPF